MLTAALRKFEGSVVVISHDRRFLEELEPTHVVTVRGGKVSEIRKRKIKFKNEEKRIHKIFKFEKRSVTLRIQNIVLV